MAPGEISDDELGKRLGAGRGYARESATQFAKRVTEELEASSTGRPPKINRAAIAAWEKGDFGSEDRPDNTRRKREDAIRIVERASGLPTQFFSIDLQRLPEMANADRMVQAMTPSERETFEARALERELADASRQSRSNADRSGGSEHESETR